MNSDFITLDEAIQMFGLCEITRRGVTTYLEHRVTFGVWKPVFDAYFKCIGYQFYRDLS